MRSTELLIDAHTRSRDVGSVRRRRVVVGVTLVAGTVLLRATLAVHSGSLAFGVRGALLAATGVAGACLAGPFPRSRRSATPRRIGGAVVCGGLAYLAFLAADLVAQRIAVLSHALATLPEPTGLSALTIAIVAVNGIGEELFFRGAVYTAARRTQPVVVTTLIYVAVTVATLNVALVIAAAVMGTVFALQRRATRGVAVPIVTHVTWSLLMLCALPR
jgi:membrane protease YdiL (CAAX protease family)